MRVKYKKIKIGMMVVFVLLFTYIFMISRPHAQTVFVSDGCSMWPDYWHYDCCYEHDKGYWEGGTAEQRFIVDTKLKQCISTTSSAFIGEIMYYTVRVGGHPIWPMPWRWDFGKPYVARYLEVQY